MPLAHTCKSKGSIKKLLQLQVQHSNWMAPIQQSYLQIVLERLPAMERNSSGIHAQQAARLQELVEFIQSQLFGRGFVNRLGIACCGYTPDCEDEERAQRLVTTGRWHLALVLFRITGSSSSSESSPSRKVSPVEGVIEDMQSRIKRLERWHTINTVLWTFLMSALVGYSLYQRKRQ